MNLAQVTRNGDELLGDWHYAYRYFIYFTF